MKKYNELEIEVVNFSKEDIVRTSVVTTPVGDEIMSDPFAEANFGN